MRPVRNLLRGVVAGVTMIAGLFVVGCDITPNIKPVYDDEYAIYIMLARQQCNGAAVVVCDTTTRPSDHPEDLPQETNDFKSLARRFHASRFEPLQQFLPDADWHTMTEQFMDHNYVSYLLDSTRFLSVSAVRLIPRRTQPGADTCFIRFSRVGFDDAVTTAVLYFESQGAGSAFKGYCAIAKDTGVWSVAGRWEVSPQ